VKRIIEDHAKAILSGRFDTLHYYLLWRGNGRRWANMIRVWGFFTDTPKSDWSKFKKNVLEMAFCRVFHTMIKTVLNDI